MTLAEIEKRYPDEESCMNFLLKSKLAKDKQCLLCGCESGQLKCYVDRSCYVCCCNNFIYPRKDTIFANSKLPLKKWFQGIYYFTTEPKLTGQKLAVFLNVNYKTAYYMIQKMKKTDLTNFFKEEK